jgi:hypothetical protein
MMRAQDGEQADCIDGFKSRIRRYHEDMLDSGILGDQVAAARSSSVYTGA